MCWSGEASTVLAVVGLGTTAWAAKRGEPKALWMALGYFSLMELLQAYTYGVIDECGKPANQISTLLGYIHIMFQPFFVNALSMHFIPKEVRAKIEVPIYLLCFVSVIVMIIQLVPMPFAGSCLTDRTLCAAELCSVSGEWHIAWDIPLNGIGNWFMLNDFPLFQNGFPTFVIIMFWIPVIYGSWRMTLFHFLFGPFLAGMSTGNPNEWPAIWCLFSIGLLMIIVKSPLRRLLYVNSWPLWWVFGRKFVTQLSPSGS